MPLIGAYIVPHPPLIVPAVGQGRQAGIAATVAAYERAAETIAGQQPDLIVFITPHGKVYEDYIHISPGRGSSGSFARYGAPEARYALEYDELFIKHLTILAETMSIPAGTLGGRGAEELDHGVMIPIHFINGLYSGYKAARVSVSWLPAETHYRFGQCLKETLAGIDRRAVIVASGDMSHKLTQDGPYGYAPEGPAFDTRLCGALREGDFLQLLAFDPVFCEKAAECGLRSFIMMAGALDGQNVRVEFGSYEGPFGVGYGVFSFKPGSENKERRFLPVYEKIKERQTAARRADEDAYARLARQTVEYFVNTGRAFTCPADLPAEMISDRAGTFVSIKKDGRLRGCIGTTEPYRINIAEEIIGNAISAAAHDPRFDAVTKDELPHLAYSVDVLSPSQPIASQEELDAARYGIIVASGHKRGLLLPNLDGVDTVAQQIAIALKKAGITEKENYELSRFGVVRHL